MSELLEASRPVSGVLTLARLSQQAAPLRNKIINALRTAIETGVLAPGTRLVEKDLCEQLNVSRTSLRELLRELEAEGVLEHSSNRSLTVARISAEEAENVYRIRAVLEALVVEQFIEKASEAEMQALIADAEILKTAYRCGVLPEMLRAKRAFYDRICSGAENSVAFGILNRMVLRTSALRSRSMLRSERQVQSVAEIETLVQAIARRDVKAAKRAARTHVANSARSSLGRDLVMER